MSEIRLEAGWKNLLGDVFDQDFMVNLRQFLKTEITQKNYFYPPAKLLFNAFDACPYDNVKLVILGQDPYHGAGQANGMSFSVARNIAIPPSLKNIYKELYDDIGMAVPSHGDLTGWAKQGVLLLNTVLSVRANTPMSHRDQGWEQFTDHVIRQLNAHKENLVFLLGGSHAQSKASLLDERKHCLLKSTHPSPLSAHRGFLGCRHFSKANEYLQQHHITPIDWADL